MLKAQNLSRSNSFIISATKRESVIKSYVRKISTGDLNNLNLSPKMSSDIKKPSSAVLMNADQNNANKVVRYRKSDN